MSIHTSDDNHQKLHTPLVVTTGEPAGIGMDIVLQLAVEDRFKEINRPVIVLADVEALAERAKSIYGEDKTQLWQVIGEADTLMISHERALDINESCFRTESNNAMPKFWVINTPCESTVKAGQLDVQNAIMVMNQLQLSHKLANANAVSAIVTGPLQKSVLIDAGLTLDDGSMFTGHTEFYMQKSGKEKVVMMLANSAMKVALVTTHLPLREVADAITSDNIRQTLDIVLDDLTQKFGLDAPKILVCGLNPHAGEGGHLGREEIEIINPVLQTYQDAGHDVSLALPADTLFTPRYLKNCDAVIAMYHDQGLPVLKSHGFGDTVNLTLGLPYIRTSVDHGTALDLAGRSVDNGDVRPSSTSLWQALTMADIMATATQ